MKPTPCIGRLLAVLVLGLAGRVFGQTSTTVDYDLPQFQNVTSGRNVQFTAGGDTGVVQWQISTDGGATFSDLAETTVYTGTKTKSLEIVGVSPTMGNYQFRFTNTKNGVTTKSSASVLTVSALQIPMPVGIATDGFDHLVVSDAANHSLYRGTVVPVDARYPVVPQHLVLSVLAGKPGETGAVDGPGSGARFSYPAGVCYDPAGGLTVADSANHAIRQVSVDGTVSTLAGSAANPGGVDGAGSAAQFSQPLGVARSSDGAYFVADSANHTIRKVSADGTVITFAGSAGNAGYSDGTGAAARFNRPSAVAVDDHGTVYVADTGNNLIRQITPAGAVTTLSGLPGIAGSADGVASQATFNAPEGIAVTHDGKTVYVADTGNSAIRVIIFLLQYTTVRTYAGVPTVSGMSDSYYGLLDHPKGIAVDDFNDYYRNRLYIADTGNAAVRVYSWDNGLETIMLGNGLTSNGVPSPFSPTQANTGTTSGSTGSTAPSSTGSGTKGGGAMDGAFVAALAGIWLFCRMTRDRSAQLRPARGE